MNRRSGIKAKIAMKNISTSDSQGSSDNPSAPGSSVSGNGAPDNSVSGSGVSGAGAQSALAGTLYGIGVGPGAPDLLTLRAVNCLRRVDVVLAAASSGKEHSLALSIAAPHLPKGAQTRQLHFPMSRNPEELKKAWAENAKTAAAILESGRNAAFITLGDPLIYSTFGYLMRTLESLYPQLPIEVVPGVTSFQTAAAETRTILCEGDENLLLTAGTNAPRRLDAALAVADSAVIVKAYRNSREIYKAVDRAGKNTTAVFVSKIGLEGELKIRGLDQAPDDPHYLSLLLLPPKRDGGGQA